MKPEMIFISNFSSKNRMFVPLILYVVIFNSVIGIEIGSGQTKTFYAADSFRPTLSPRDHEEECTTWHLTCAQFQRDNTSRKACYGQTLFYATEFQGGWSELRFYCSSIFHSNKRADLLYFYEQNDYDLKSFVEKLKPSDSVFPTSALCCLTGMNNGRVHCQWIYNNKEIDQKYYSDVRLDENSCTFLMVNLKSPNGFKFTKAIKINQQQSMQAICTYKIPEYCPDIPTTGPDTDPTNPLTTPTTPTEKPGVKYCQEKHNSYNIDYWPKAEINGFSVAKCPPNTNGTAVWRCCSNGEFDPEGPKITCAKNWIDDASKNITKAKDLKELSDRAQDFHQNVRKDPAKFPDDLVQIVREVNRIHVRFESFAENATEVFNGPVAVSITASMMASCSDVIESDSAWNITKSDIRIQVAQNLLNTIQFGGVTLGCFAARNDSSDFNKRPITPPNNNSNIFMAAFSLDDHQPIEFSYFQEEFRLTNSIYNDDNVSDWCQHQIGVGAMFRKLSTYMTDSESHPDILVNSEIVAFSYNNRTEKTVPLPKDTEAQISLTHHTIMDFGTEAQCVFWDFSQSKWNSAGCWVDYQKSNRNQTSCICNHLTNFAVLLDVSNREEQSQLKSILTIVTCAISIICLAFVILFFMICRELKSRRSTIIVNISAIMIIINILVIFGLDLTNYPIICKSVAVLLLYWMLALFFWMLMEGYNLYQMMVLIFDTKGRLRMLYLYLIGYGIPFLITAGASIYMYLVTELTNDYFCWITSKKYPYQIWIVAGPATLIILINTVIMIRVMKIVLSKRTKASQGAASAYTTTTSSSGGVTGMRTNRKTPTTPPSNKHHNITLAGRGKQRKSGKSGSRAELYLKHSNDSNGDGQPTIEQRMSEWFSYLKGFLGLMVLMGITWISYLLYVHEKGHYFSYLFIVMNGLQGVFIFITQFLLNKKAMMAARRQINRMLGRAEYGSSTTSSSKNGTTSTSISHQRATGRTNQQRQTKNDDDDDDDGPVHRYPYRDALIDRTTSIDF